MDFGGKYNVSMDNMAFGIEYGVEASAVAGTGTSYNGYRQSVTFMGGKYANYCYDYLGGEAQAVGGGVDVSVGVQANLLIGIFLGNPQKSTPESFAGSYQGINGSLSVFSNKLWTVDINASFALSRSAKNKWLVITIGPSVSVGCVESIGRFTAGYHIGGSKLIGTPIPTKDRSNLDIISNMLFHSYPLLWLF